MPEKTVVELLFRLVDKVSLEAKRVASSLKDIQKSADKSTESIDKMSKKGTKDIVPLNKALKDVDTSLHSIALAAGVLGTALGAPFVLGTSKAADFEQAMSTVLAVSGATSEEFENMTAVAKELGATTRYTATEAADGFKFLSMAGLKAADAMEALPSVLQLAQAGAMDLGEAADITTNILTGYGMAASDLAHVNDVLVTGFTNSNSTLQELGTAFTYVGPIAKGVGAEFETLVGTLGALHNAGLKGSLAGTTLRGTLDALYNPTQREAKLMKELGNRIGDAGLQIKDSEGNFVGFTRIIEQLEAAGLTAEEALRLFGQRAGPGMVALMQQGSESLDEFSDKLHDVDGAASRIAKTMDDNLKGILKLLTSALDGLLVSIGDKLIPILGKAAKAATWLVSQFKDFHDFLGPIATIVDVLLVSMAGLAVSVGALGIAWTFTISPLLAFISAIGAAGGVSTVLTTALVTLNTAVHTVASGFITLLASLGPITLALTALTVSVLAVIAVHKLLDEDLEETAKLAVKEADAFNKMGASIDSYLNKISELKEGTKEFKEETLKLREELLGIAKEYPEFSKEVEAATNSIDKNTGAIEDNNEAIEYFKSLALFMEYQKIADQGAVLNKQLQDLSEQNTFTELKKQAEGFGEVLTEDQEEIKELLREVERQAYDVLQAMIKTGKVNPFESSVEDVKELGSQLGIISEDAGILQGAVVKAFEDMSSSAIKEADKTVEALIKISDPKNVVTIKMIREFEDGLERIQNAQYVATNKLVNNTKYMGKRTVSEYQQMYFDMNVVQRKGFLRMFIAHENQAQDIYYSSKSSTEKELALAESKKQFLLNIERSISIESAKTRINSYQSVITIAEKYHNEELIKLELNAAAKIAAAKIAGESVADIEKNIADGRATIEADLIVKKLAASKIYFQDTQIAYGLESDQAQEAADKVKQYAKEVSDFKISEYGRRTDALQTALDESLSKEQEYMDNIGDLRKKILDVTTSTEDKIRTIRQKNMSDVEKQGDLELQANEKLSESKKALAAHDFDRAEALAKQAQNIASGLKNEQKAIGGVKKAGYLLIDMYEKQKATQEESLKTQQELSKNLSNSLKDVTSTVKELVSELQMLRGADIIVSVDTSEVDSDIKMLAEPTDKTVTMVSDSDNAWKDIYAIEEPGMKEIDINVRTRAAQAAINKLKANTSSVHTVYINKVEKNAVGGLAGAFTRKSGRLPGFGKEDVVPSLLTWGERVLNSTSTKIWDQAFPGFMDLANSIKSSSSAKQLMSSMSIPKLALGGYLDKAQVHSPASFSTGAIVSSPSSEITVNLNLPVRGKAIPTHMSQIDAEELINQLKSLNRLRS